MLTIDLHEQFSVNWPYKVWLPPKIWHRLKNRPRDAKVVSIGSVLSTEYDAAFEISRDGQDLM